MAGSALGLAVTVSFPAWLALRSERGQGAAAAAGASRGAAWAARPHGDGRRLGGCIGGVGGIAASNEGFEPRLCHDLEVTDKN